MTASNTSVCGHEFSAQQATARRVRGIRVTVFGAQSPVWMVSGCNAFGRLSTVDDQGLPTGVRYERLEARGWTWHPIVGDGTGSSVG